MQSARDGIVARLPRSQWQQLAFPQGPAAQRGPNPDSARRCGSHPAARCHLQAAGEDDQGVQIHRA